MTTLPSAASLLSAGEQTAGPPLSPGAACPSLWGLDPLQLHDYFWAARGVFVVRLGERDELAENAELYLLSDASTLATFRLAPFIDVLQWVNPSVLFLRILAAPQQSYRERVVVDERGQFTRFRRIYGGGSERLTRLALTRDPGVAAVWQKASNAQLAWKQLRRQTRGQRHEVVRVRGRVYDRHCEADLVQLVSDMVRVWHSPAATVSHIRRLRPRVWASREVELDASVTTIGPVWIGAGRKLEPNTTILGPTVLWDAPESRPQPEAVHWSELEATPGTIGVQRGRAVRKRRTPPGKRLFDVVAALLLLMLTLPLYPLIMLAIWIESGRPFFFVQRRQTLHGREFPCLKFRSMQKNADRIKAQLATTNEADGPQFFIKWDPRLTRVGRFLRKLHIDELPQFINVLLGQMSIVGPRPSPSGENQFSPAWREARLSVRAGITGLWQVRRTRRPGLDFQEWIKYDMEYVRGMSWRMDLGIIVRTVRIILRK